MATDIGSLVLELGGHEKDWTQKNTIGIERKGLRKIWGKYLLHC
jgi:hypothetical protein